MREQGLMGLPVSKEELEGMLQPSVRRRLRSRATRRLKRGRVEEALWIYHKLFEEMAKGDPEDKVRAVDEALRDVEKLRAYGSNAVAVELLREVLRVADELKHPRREKIFRWLLDLWLSAISFEIRRTLYFYEEGYIWVHHERPALKARMQGFYEFNLARLHEMFVKMLADVYSAIYREPHRGEVLEELEDRLSRLQEMIFYLGDLTFREKMREVIARWLDKLKKVAQAEQAEGDRREGDEEET